MKKAKPKRVSSVPYVPEAPPKEKVSTAKSPGIDRKAVHDFISNRMVQSELGEEDELLEDLEAEKGDQ